MSITALHISNTNSISAENGGSIIGFGPEMGTNISMTVTMHYSTNPISFESGPDSVWEGFGCIALLVWFGFVLYVGILSLLKKEIK